MKWSKYNHIWKLDNDKYMVFNSIKNSLICIDEKIVNKIESQSFEREEISELVDLGILTQYHDESQLAIYEMTKQKFKNSSMAFWIYTTMDCNFSCPYCFESRINSDNKINIMDENTLNETVKWCSKRISEIQPDDVLVTFMGGEPFLNISAITGFADKIKDYEFSDRVIYNVITNGSLMNEENLDQLIQRGIKRFQITIDGLKSIQDKRRPYKEGKSGFELIINNIIFALDKYKDHIEIIVKITIDDDNINHIWDLFMFLEKYGLKKRILIGLGDVIHDGDGCGGRHKPATFERIVEIYSMASKRGFNINFLELNICWMPSELFFMMAVNGDIYKCPSLVGNEKFCVGNVFKDELYMEYYRQVNMCNWKECIECEFVGICAGGCMYRRFMEKGVFEEGKYCRKKYVKELIESKFTQKYRLLMES